MPSSSQRNLSLDVAYNILERIREIEGDLISIETKIFWELTKEEKSYFKIQSMLVTKNKMVKFKQEWELTKERLKKEKRYITI